MERYSDTGLMNKNSTGGWVRYSDHAAIVAEHEAVAVALAEMVSVAEFRKIFGRHPESWQEGIALLISEARRRNEVKG